ILRNLNQQYFDAGGFPTGVIPYANLGAIEFRDNVGNSTYHGLELSAQKRFSHDFSLTAAYTWSHSIDQVQEHLISGSGSNSFLQNEHGLREQRGNSTSISGSGSHSAICTNFPLVQGSIWANKVRSRTSSAVGAPAVSPPSTPVVPSRSSPAT